MKQLENIMKIEINQISYIVDVLRSANIPLGCFYIIAPENACSGEVNISDWDEVWQYGTNEQKTPAWLQDGVAPQCGVNNLYDIPNKSGRAYIPDNEPQGFVESHSIDNYKWVFTKLKNGQDGYVNPRK